MADESVLNGDKMVPEKLKPFIFDICGYNYYEPGKVAGMAFHGSMAIK